MKLIREGREGEWEMEVGRVGVERWCEGDGSSHTLSKALAKSCLLNNLRALSYALNSSTVVEVASARIYR